MGADGGQGAGLPVPDWARVFDEAPAPFLLLTPELVIVHANRERLAATATTLADTVGRNLFEVFPMNPDDPAADGMANLQASLELARDTRRPVTMPIQKYDIPLPDGTWEERFWAPRNVPILDDRGRVVLLLHRADDITGYIRDRDAARLEAARGQRWRERVAEVESDLFSRTRELEQVNAELRRLTDRERRTAESLAGLARTVSALAGAQTRADLVRELSGHGRVALHADVLSVGLLAQDGRHLAVVDGGLEGGRGDERRVPVDSPLPMAVAAGGSPVLVADADIAGPDAVPPAPGVRSWAALPLQVGGRPLGSLTVGWRRARTLEDDDVQVLEAFAAQTGQALDRVERLERERRAASATRSLAEALQRSLLTDPPQPDHLAVAVRYRPAALEAEVGGDWYDVFLSPDGATTLVVGDVTGHDRTAAAGMGQLRNMLRGIAHATDGNPAELLGALDRAVRDLGMPLLATAVLARVEQEPDEFPVRRLRWSNAGHPPPLLLGPDGAAQLLDRPPNLLLGVDATTLRQQHTVALPPGATVVLYTDGLVERRDATLDDGLARLVRAVGDLTDRPVEEFCDALLTRMDPAPADDVALVVLRVADPDARD